jgi:hypothetical protein
LRTDGPSRRGDAAAFLRRLEDFIGKRTEAHSQVALAYSGGLASTILAMVARKRCELECIVAGAADSADVHAALEAARYLDLRVTPVVLDASAIKRILRWAEAQGLRHPIGSFASVLPVLAVRERTTREVVLTGFGIRRVHPPILDSLLRLGTQAPWAGVSHGEPISRNRVRAAAISLGLPEELARVPHRDPADGAGVTAFLEEIETEDARQPES